MKCVHNNDEINLLHWNRGDQAAIGGWEKNLLTKKLPNPICFGLNGKNDDQDKLTSAWRTSWKEFIFTSSHLHFFRAYERCEWPVPTNLIDISLLANCKKKKSYRFGYLAPIDVSVLFSSASFFFKTDRSIFVRRQTKDIAKKICQASHDELLLPTNEYHLIDGELVNRAVSILHIMIDVIRNTRTQAHYLISISTVTIGKCDSLMWLVDADALSLRPDGLLSSIGN